MPDYSSLRHSGFAWTSNRLGKPSWEKQSKNLKPLCHHRIHPILLGPIFGRGKAALDISCPQDAPGQMENVTLSQANDSAPWVWRWHREGHVASCGATRAPGLLPGLLPAPPRSAPPCPAGMGAAGPPGPGGHSKSSYPCKLPGVYIYIYIYNFHNVHNTINISY